MVRSHSILRSAGMLASPCPGHVNTSYSSVFNVTNNYYLGGGGGCFGGGVSGFWGGFGMGLGQAFGSLFSGLGGMFGGMFGGFGNMFSGFGMNLFGGFGFGNMFGGFGLGGMFGGLGNIWGGGFGNFWGGSSAGSSGSSKSKCDCDCSSHRSSSTGADGAGGSARTIVEKDADDPIILDYEAKIKALKEKPTLNQILKLYGEIEKLSKKPKDDIEKETNIRHYERMLDELKSIAKGNHWDIGNTQVEEPAVISIPPSTPEVPETIEITVPDGQGGQGGNSGNITTKSTLESALKSIKDSDKNIGFIKTISDDVKSEYYQQGYTNYDGQTNITNVIRAHDANGKSTPRDVFNVNGKPASVTKANNGNHPQSIVINDSREVTYTFKGNAGSEYIYESNQDNQLYVLQKDVTGKYHLMQYEYMKGWNKPDVKTGK